MILTYKYRIKDSSARKVLRRHAWAVNQVWNWCVGQQRDVEARYKAGGPARKWAGRFDLAKACKGAGADLGLHQQTVQEVCRQFASSRDAARRACRFRASTGPKRALGWVPFQQQSRQVEGNSLTYLGKRIRWFGNRRRPLPENAKGGAFVEDASGRWYITFNVEVESLEPGAGLIGIDLGLKTLATLSEGSRVDALQPYRRYETMLATAQRAGNRRRARAIHAKIANVRRDHIHKATGRIARENILIAVGNVNAAGLAKTGMAKSVYDAGWTMFRTQLRYKASRHGAVFIETDETFTTQTCSRCQAIPGSSPKGRGALGIRTWECSECRASHDRDMNAARNILISALSAQRRGDESRRSLQ